MAKKCYLQRRQTPKVGQRIQPSAFENKIREMADTTTFKELLEQNYYTKSKCIEDFKYCYFKGIEESGLST